MLGSMWKWVDAGKTLKQSKKVHFLKDGSLKWNNKRQKGSSWKLTNNNKVLEIDAKILRFVRHFKYDADEGRALEINNPESTSSVLWGKFLSEKFNDFS